MLPIFHKPSARPVGDWYWDNVVFFLDIPNENNSTAFIDSKMHQLSLTGQVKSTTSILYNGNATAVFDGTSDIISSPDSPEWDFNNGDFTVELVMQIQSYPASFFILLSQSNIWPDTSWFISMGSNRRFAFYARSTVSESPDEILLSPLDTITANQTCHIGITRSGNTFTAFFNGEAVATATWPYTIRNSSETLKIGAGVPDGAGYDFSGNIGAVRITKGIARANGGYNDAWSNFK